MPDHSHDEAVNVETRREHSDVNVRALLWSVVVFLVLMGIIDLTVYAYFRVLAGHFRHEPSQPLTMMAPRSAVPATPRLQPFPSKTIPPNANTPVTDMEEMRGSQDAALNHPGWVDQQNGVVRLPIETAKQLVVQRGLPVVKEGTP